MPISSVDLDFYESLPPEHREEWLFERTACDSSLFYFIAQMGGMSIKAGEDVSSVIHKPICDFWQDDSIRFKGVAMPRAWLKCVHPDTLVQMEDGGEKRISELDIRDKIVGYDGFKQCRSSVVSTFKGEADLYKIVFRSGREIIVSDRHAFMQIEGYSTLPKYGAYPRGLKTTPTSNISEDEAALITYFVTEGCLVSGNMSFTNGIPEVQNDFERIINSFGWSYRKNIHWGCNEYRVNGGGKLNKQRGGPREWARKTGIWGKDSFNKELPYPIMSASDNVIKRVVGVLFATDGTLGVYDNHPQICYSSVNKKLCLQVQNLLNRFGVFSEILFIKNKYNGSYQLKVSGKDSFNNFIKTFRVVGKDAAATAISSQLEKWSENPDTSYPNLIPNEVKKQITETGLRKLGLRVDNNYRMSRGKAAKIPSISRFANTDVNWDDVVSCEPLGVGVACDIQTTSGNYVANGMITHNSTCLTKWGNLWRYLQNNEVRVLLPSQKIDLPVSFVKFIKKQAVANSRLRYLYPVLHRITKSWRHSNSWGSAECELPRKGIYSEGTFRAIGLGGGSQGGHFDYVSPDDAISEKGMESKLVIEDAQRWFDNVEELLDNKETGVVSVCGSHWGPGDFNCYIQREYKYYKWMIVPAIKDSKLENTENIIYHQNPNVEDGESNWPELWPTEVYTEMQANPQKVYIFMTQHQNTPEGANIATKFDKRWLKYYRWVERGVDRFIVCNDDNEEFRLGSFPTYGIIDPGGFSQKILSKQASRTAVLVGGQPAGTHKKFITHAWAGRFKEPTKFLDEIFRAYNEVKPILFRQEIFGQQRYILEDIRKESKIRRSTLRVIELESDERKDAKDANIQALCGPMANGEIYIHESMKDLISEVVAYPGGFTVDLLDALAKLNQHYWKRGTKQDMTIPITSRQVYGQTATNRTGY